MTNNAGNTMGTASSSGSGKHRSKIESNHKLWLHSGNTFCHWRSFLKMVRIVKSICHYELMEWTQNVPILASSNFVVWYVTSSQATMTQDQTAETRVQWTHIACKSWDKTVDNSHQNNHPYSPNQSPTLAESTISLGPKNFIVPAAQ
jgi:hypothetical protein